MKKQIDAELAAWCKILSFGSAEPEAVPKGWFTIKELAEKTKRSPCTISERMRRLVEQGKAEKKPFTIQLVEKVRPVAHFRLKK